MTTLLLSCWIYSKNQTNWSKSSCCVLFAVILRGISSWSSSLTSNVLLRFLTHCCRSCRSQGGAPYLCHTQTFHVDKRFHVAIFNMPDTEKPKRETPTDSSISNGFFTSSDTTTFANMFSRHLSATLRMHSVPFDLEVMPAWITRQKTTYAHLAISLNAGEFSQRLRCGATNPRTAGMVDNSVAARTTCFTGRNRNMIRMHGVFVTT